MVKCIYSLYVFSIFLTRDLSRHLVTHVNRYTSRYIEPICFVGYSGSMDTSWRYVSCHISREYYLSRILSSWSVYRCHIGNCMSTLILGYTATHTHICRRSHALCRSELYYRIIFPERKPRNNSNRLEETPPLDDTYQYARSRPLRSWKDAISEMDHRNSRDTQSPLLSRHDCSGLYIPGCNARARGKSLLSSHRSRHLVWI